VTSITRCRRGQPSGNRGVVSDDGDNRTELAIYAFEHVKYKFPGNIVERAGGVVAEQNFRALRYCPRDGDTLLYRWERSLADLMATLQQLEHVKVGLGSLTEALHQTTASGRAIAEICVSLPKWFRRCPEEKLSKSRGVAPEDSCSAICSRRSRWQPHGGWRLPCLNCYIKGNKATNEVIAD
jgi:hypothetical protein